MISNKKKKKKKKKTKHFTNAHILFHYDIFFIKDMVILGEYIAHFIVMTSKVFGIVYKQSCI